MKYFYPNLWYQFWPFLFYFQRTFIIIFYLLTIEVQQVTFQDLSSHFLIFPKLHWILRFSILVIDVLQWYSPTFSVQVWIAIWLLLHLFLSFAGTFFNLFLNQLKVILSSFISPQLHEFYYSHFQYYSWSE